MPARPLLIFDCDGVLVDSELLEHGVDVEVLGRHDISTTLATLLERFLGVARRDMYRIIFSDLGRPIPAGLLEERERMVWERCRTNLAAIPGIDEALGALGAWPKCVASSSTPDKLLMKLGSTGLARHFGAHVFSTALVARGKPAPDIYLHAAAAVGHRPEACVVIEDSPAGVAGAKQAGMKVLGFTGGGHATASLRQALIEAGADVVVGQPREIEGALRSIEESLDRGPPGPLMNLSEPGGPRSA
ncbi:MAG: HAD-IA family hydrolase [Alphaproteobacteria bacterium]|nr:HAD-IA family hydrolase [Alphaproteobacteria bacterium]